MRFFLTLAVALLSLSACSEEQDSGKLKVVTTFTIIADIASNVAGDAADVQSITKPGAEIHDYQPTPKDIVKAQNADIILWNGLNLERWFERFFADVKGAPSAIVSEGITPLSIYEGAYQGKPNPHAWMSTSNALIYVENIRKALSDLDPENAPIYAANARSYSAKIESLKSAAENFKAVPQNARVLVTSEGAFSYLAKDLGLEELYIWPINAESQGSPHQVRKVIDTMRTRKIPVIFSESTVSDKPARQIAAEAGVRYGGILYVDSLSEAGGPVPTYLDLLKTTTQTIVKGFNE